MTMEMVWNNLKWRSDNQILVSIIPSRCSEAQIHCTLYSAVDSKTGLRLLVLNYKTKQYRDIISTADTGFNLYPANVENIVNS
jgi:hypothetical protein